MAWRLDLGVVKLDGGIIFGHKKPTNYAGGRWAMVGLLFI